MSSNVDRVTAITEELIERGAPWSAGTTWQIVLLEAVLAGVVGLVMLFAPLGGAATVLQVVGLLLLALAVIGAFQVWRQRVRPDRANLASFRAGSGVTTGVLVLAATILVGVTDAVTAALAVVLGVGFLVFGLAGALALVLHREPDERINVAVMGTNVVVAVIGIVLVLAGAGGADAVRSVFTALGIVLIVAGVALGGWAYLLYQRHAGASSA
jgi:uncharacterized membrane protein HdeD (DUF308 family)